MRKDLYYKTYLRTRDMYCDSGYANDYRVKCYLTKENVLQTLRCPRCFCEFKTMNCAEQHVRNRKCWGQQMCLELNCGIKLTFGSKENKKIALEEHVCGKKRLFCKTCHKYHLENQSHCFLESYERKTWQKFPKICVIAGAVSDHNSFVDCYQCNSDPKNEKCKYHVDQSGNSYVNFLYILREIEKHGVFFDQYVDENGFQTEAKEKYRAPYEPVFEMPTDQFEKITKGVRSRQRGKMFVQKYQPQNTLEILIKDILMTPSYQNSIAIISENLIPYVVKTLDNLKMKFSINNAQTRVELAWPNVAFTSLSCYLNDYEGFINAGCESFFPLLINFRKWYNLNDLPSFQAFKNLSDSHDLVQKKVQFYEKIQNETWNFQNEMKKYLMEKGKLMLFAIVKLANLSFKIQEFLRNNYPLAAWKNVGSIFQVKTVATFFYSLLLHYIKFNLEKPIYSLSFAEKGIYSGNTSQKEYFFQHYVKFLRPSSVLISSFLTPEGPKRFGQIICDLYDESLNEAIFLNGCYWLAVRDLK